MKYFWDLVDLDLTYLGWCFKVISFLTDYEHQSLVLSTSQKKFDLGMSPKIGQMRVIPNSRKKYLKNKLGPLFGILIHTFISEGQVICNTAQVHISEISKPTFIFLIPGTRKDLCQNKSSAGCTTSFQIHLILIPVSYFFVTNVSNHLWSFLFHHKTNIEHDILLMSPTIIEHKRIMPLSTGIWKSWLITKNPDVKIKHFSWSLVMYSFVQFWLYSGVLPKVLIRDISR